MQEYLRLHSFLAHSTFYPVGIPRKSWPPGLQLCTAASSSPLQCQVCWQPGYLRALIMSITSPDGDGSSSWKGLPVSWPAWSPFSCYLTFLVPRLAQPVGSLANTSGNVLRSVSYEIEYRINRLIVPFGTVCCLR